MTAAEERCLVALHEAGHAIVGQELGLTVRKAVIRSDGTGGCQVERDLRTLAAIERELTLLLAGPLAEANRKRGFLSSAVLRNTIACEARTRDEAYEDYVKAAAESLGGNQAKARRWLDTALRNAADEAVSTGSSTSHR